jgi:hypothetical protein
MTKSADIIDSFQEQGVPSRLTGPWAGQPCDPAFFDLPEEEELLQHLLERFALEDLIKCGIVRSESDERVTLSPRVTENHLYLRPLTKSAGKRPFDLLMGAGGTLTGECSLLAALDDRNFAVAAECDGGRVFVSEFAEDVAILHSLRLPAAPARDLACLVGERLEVFCQKLHLVPAPTEAGEEKRRGRTKKLRIAEPPLPMSVVIVNWRLGQLTREDIPSAL